MAKETTLGSNTVFFFRFLVHLFHSTEQTCDTTVPKKYVFKKILSLCCATREQSLESGGYTSGEKDSGFAQCL